MAGLQPGASAQGAGAWGSPSHPAPSWHRSSLAVPTISHGINLPESCRLGWEQRCVFAIECSFLIPPGTVGGLFGSCWSLRSWVVPANPAWEWWRKWCRLGSQAGIAPPSSPPPHFSFQEPGMTVTNITALTSGPRGHSSPCKRKHRKGWL